MAGVIETLLFSFTDLLRATLMLGIPILVIAFAGRAVFARLRARFSWIQSAAAASYITILPLIIVAYLGPFVLGLADLSQGPVPQTLAPDLVARLSAFVITMLRVLVLSGFFTLLLLPLVLAGTAISDAISQRVADVRLRFALAVLGSIFIALVLVLFILPPVGIQLIPALIYLVYFA